MRRYKRASASQINNKFLFSLRVFLFERKKLRGQWFIISAVVASSVFFALSLLMKDYFAFDSSYFAGLNNDHYFYSTVEQFNRVVATTPSNGSCANLSSNLNELKTTAEKELSSRGLFPFFEYQIIGPCASVNNARLDFLVASQNEILYNFSTYSSPVQVIGAV